MGMALAVLLERGCLGMHKKCLIRPLEEDDLSMVLAWRNNPQIRSSMLRRHEILPGEHKEWFLHARKDETDRQLIVEELGEPIGFVRFKGVMRDGIVEWGFYLRPNSPKGSGKKLGITALNYAFNQLKIYKVFGQVLESNAKSLKFHASMGFVREGVLRDQYYINGEYISMICFGLIVNEWERSSLII
jgi:UDP-4-amino-4,6-dideoxy-N-acetyl-beta-L-altrosamine N-acetyltransferase